MASGNPAIPATMRALALSKFCKPSEYAIATLPTPEIAKPDEVLIKVHAASVNPVDVKMASGTARVMGYSTFPYKIGYDLAGTIVSTGASVTSFKPGDAVYARIHERYRGSIAEYAVSTESAVALKPPSLSFTEAAAIPLAGLTALQSLDTAARMIEGGTLNGKTIYVPGGLSGTGSFAVQLAKRVFGAKEVITTLSTGKIAKLGELIGPGVVDEIVDYTKENVEQKIGPGRVDVMFDTVTGTLRSIPLMKKNGVIVSVSTVPSGELMMRKAASLNFFLKQLLNGADWVLRTWTRWKGVQYTYVFMDPSGKDLDRLTKAIEEGRLKPVIGMTAKLEDIEQVKKGCQQVFDGKGGVGKFVIEVV
ncbi:chaperonin 10-like protein [Xylogone sp. PMI_703]|nr:chaperonin 10-like protein [Xylogone sp. PMI_703]